MSMGPTSFNSSSLTFGGRKDKQALKGLQNQLVSTGKNKKGAQKKTVEKLAQTTKEQGLSHKEVRKLGLKA